MVENYELRKRLTENEPYSVNIPEEAAGKADALVTALASDELGEDYLQSLANNNEEIKGALSDPRVNHALREAVVEKDNYKIRDVAMVSVAREYQRNNNGSLSEETTDFESLETLVQSTIFTN